MVAGNVELRAVKMYGIRYISVKPTEGTKHIRVRDNNPLFTIRFVDNELNETEIFVLRTCLLDLAEKIVDAINEDADARELARSDSR